MLCERLQKEDKGQAIDWEKIFANHIFDRGLVSRTYKKLKTQQQKNLIRKWAKNTNKQFTEDI